MSAEKAAIKSLVTSSITVLSLIREIMSFIMMQEYRVLKKGLTCESQVVTGDKSKNEFLKRYILLQNF